MPHKDPEARRAYLRSYNAANQDRLRSLHRQWQENNREKLSEYRKRHHAKRLEDDLESVRREQRQAWLMRQYGLTIGDHESLVAAHDNRCAICKVQADDGKPLHIDHDHKTGRVRGLLCGHCNRGIGLFRDNPAVLRRAIEYLRGVEEGEL